LDRANGPVEIRRGGGAGREDCANFPAESCSTVLELDLVEFIRCDMLRLTALLCVGIFLVLMIEGEDNGQVRQGLLFQSEPANDPVRIASPEPVTPPPATGGTEAVFVPAQPVRVLPPPQTERVARPVVATPAPVPAEIWAVVNARSINVRSGPSTNDAVIGRLVDGEAVLVVSYDTLVQGWSLVRIEGDGIEGYVASRLLTELQP